MTDTKQDMVNIEINGVTLQVAPGSMVIEAADAAGITIPRFCYHKKLSVAANCRMCLVEVEKVGKPLPACATPVTDGMQVFTKSPLALEAQKSVMEFLLINHPLDCPICDQGGECDLQDLAIGYGRDVSRFAEKKRVIREKDIGPLIATEMTRCIHCTRCVRFGMEVAGLRELGATGRGEHTEIGTYVESTIDSEMSGNVIDLCPVGALTAKPSRYTSRPWENQQHFAVSPHDCVGSNLLVETRRNQVIRVLPHENEAINEVWLSDRDRFSYTGLGSEERLSTPMIKQGDKWHAVDWQTALSYAVEGMERVKQVHGVEKMGALCSASSTLEEMFLLQKLMRGLGSQNIDHRTHQLDMSDQDIEPIFPWLGQSISDLENLDAALLIGSNIHKDQPIIAHRLRKAACKGAKVMFVNPLYCEFNFPVEENIVSSPSEMVKDVLAICKALHDLTGSALPDGMAGLFKSVESHDSHLNIAKHLHSAESATVLIGTQTMNQEELATIRAVSNVIAQMSQAKLGYLSFGANSVGAYLAGAVPHRGTAGAPLSAQGLSVRSMLGQEMGGMVLLNLEPEYDCAESSVAIRNLRETDFVVSLTPYVTDTMKTYTDVLLPVTPFTETSGTYVNIEGYWQNFAASVKPLAESRPAWKVLRVLGNLLDVDGFDFITSEQVRDECRGHCNNIVASTRTEWKCPAKLAAVPQKLTRIGYLPIYATDNIVRRAAPLQKTKDAMPVGMYINKATLATTKLEGAEKGVISQNSTQAVLPVLLDERVPDHCVMVPVGVKGSDQLGNSYGPVELAKS